MDDIIEWLRSLGLAEYVPLFAENRIDASVLPTLTEQDLKDLGITRFGDRRKLTIAIAARTEAPVPAEAAASATATSPSTDNAPKPSHAAERRHLTVMFCDLVGSTALAARLDPEDMREVVRAYQGACAQVIGRYEGFVAQYLGDGIMAYFGYPAAHEDDAERAVRAGLDLVTAVAKLDGKAKVEVRVGIATGLVVVGDLIGEHAAKERAVTGETPNLAARLQGLAPPGSIVVSARTRRLLGGQFDLRDLGAQQVKGLDAPVAAFAVDGVRSFESRFEARAGGITGFVGREEECEHLLDRWKLARQGRGQVVLVSGEAGIGKSRLTAWLVDKVAPEPHTRLRFQCTPHHKDSALYPSIAQLERAAGIEANEPCEAKLAKLEALLVLAETEAAETVPLFAALLAIPTDDRYPPLSMSPGQQRQRTLAALLDQVEGLALQKPLLMIYEDAHWADATSLELLNTLVDRLARLPVFFVMTGRPEFSPAWAGRHNVSTVTLQKLDKRETRAMVESVTGGAALPLEVLDQIVAKTDGVPLFVEELTKTVLEAGALVEDGSSLKATAALPIPATLQDSLMARLDRSNPVKEIAQIGAAIGREFSYQLLLAVAGMDEATARTGFAKLEEAELATRRGVPPDATYTFKHALVQDAAYESLLKSRRQTLHRRIAKALRDRFPVLAETEPEIIAHHFTQAGNVEQAADWWAKAGEVARRRSALAEAINHFEKGISLADGLPDDPRRQLGRLHLQLAYGDVLASARGFNAPQTTAAYTRAAELGASIADPIEKFRAIFGVWTPVVSSGQTFQALALSEALLRDFGTETGRRERMLGNRMRGVTRFFAGDLAAAVSCLETSIANYDPEKDAPLTFQFGINPGASVPLHLGLSLWIIGRCDQAREVMAGVMTWATQIAHAPTLAFANGYECHYKGLTRDFAGMLASAETLRSMTAEHGMSLWEAVGTFYEGAARFCLSERSFGMDLMNDGHRRMHASGTHNFLPLKLLFFIDAQAQSDRDGALARVQETLCLTAASGQRVWDAELHRLHGNILHRHFAHRSDAAEAAFLQAIGVTRTQQARSFELRAALDLARLYCDTGREREAVPLLQGALVGFTETPELPEIGEAQRLLRSLVPVAWT